MKLALLKGNRFNPWHLAAFARLHNNPTVVAFRAESEIQKRFDYHDDGSLTFQIERIYFDNEIGNPIARFYKSLRQRYGNEEPTIVPFHERLQDFDVIHSWELFTDWTEQAVIAKQQYGIPLALMVWDNIPFNMERQPRRRQLKEQAAEHAEVFIVHSERSRRMLSMENVPEEKIRLLSPGVDIDTFRPGPSNRSAFSVDDNEFVILFVGWLLPRKGADFLILTLRELVHDRELKDHTFRLLIAGADPGRERLEALMKRLGVHDHCTFLGVQPYATMPNLYRAADVFVLPSIATPDWQEQFGMALIEAMACGLPAVATYSGAIPEIGGDAAILCQPNDFFSLYESIKQLALDSTAREQRRQQSRARAEAHFDLTTYATRLSEIYDELTR